MIFGELTAASYDDRVATDPRIDALRDRMEVRENQAFTIDYFDPEKRGIGNAVQVFFKDGSATDRIEVSYPIGHRRRRAEGIPLLMNKFEKAVAGRFDADQARVIVDACRSRSAMEAMSVPDFVDLWCKA
jgi:2-methylcitrate dehydratase